MKTVQTLMQAGLVPVGAAMLVVGAALWGGGWTVTAFVWILLFAIGFGRAAPRVATEASARVLPPVLGCLHFVVLWASIYGLAAQPGANIGLFFAAGLYFGQVSNSAAHELIHRPDRVSFWLGAAVLMSHLFGHHASAHRLVHHTHVATPRDPNSARRGESAYRFLPRAWLGSFRQGLRTEMRLRGSGMWATPYPIYVLGACAALLVSAAIAGWHGVFIHLLLAGYATLQLLLSDYVQHYGLSRAEETDGKFAPVTPAHSWDAPRAGPGWLMLNAPRHAAHHVRPATRYPALDLPQGAPQLPYSLAVMGAIALVPPVWRRIMHERLRQYASP